MIRVLLFVITILVVISPVYSQASPFLSSSRGISVNEGDRPISEELLEWLLGPISYVRSGVPIGVHHQVGGMTIRVSVEVSDDALYILFLRAKGVLYPIAQRGNMVVKRSLDDGSFLQLKIFLDDSGESFIRCFPMEERSLLELIAYGKRIVSELPIPVAFDRLLATPLQTIMELTSERVPWGRFTPVGDRPGDRTVEALVHEIRTLLPSLGDSDDGAMDELGRLVLIESLEPQRFDAGFNCSGFAKWIIDGMVFPETETLLSISPLKEKPLSVRGNSLTRRYEADRDPFFGLDWTRNLGKAIRELKGSADVGIEAGDVRDVQFFSYVEDVGYPIEELKPLLYQLAHGSPGYIYLGSLNQSFGSDPVVRQHTHVVLLFPHFTRRGEFQPVVMERNWESSVESIADRYRGEHIHLVRVEATSEFFLPGSALSALR